jgi:Bacterial Ig-like domain
LINRGTNIRPPAIDQFYRLLVAIGVIFTVLLVIIYLNSMITVFISTSNSNITALLETQKNFLTIVGTAFASLVAFYFGTRASQRSNAEGMTAIMKPEAGQKALEVIDVNPIDGSMGVEVEFPVTATFSAPVRSSTINANTFSVKDANGNPAQGKITLTDNNKTIKFNPISPLSRNSKYTVTITKELMDVSGASMSADKEWHFTTVA